MKCYKCKCSTVVSGKAFYPIDPKGTGRRWACSDCLTDEQLKEKRDDIVEAILKDNEIKKCN